jgi:hypothetical protein
MSSDHNTRFRGDGQGDGMRQTPSQQDQEILKLLETLKSSRVDYPQDLLVRRRAALIAKLEKQQVKNSSSLEKDALIELFTDLKQDNAKYPPILLAKRRAAFLDQAKKHRRVGWLKAFSSGIRNIFTVGQKAPRMPMINSLRGLLIVFTLTTAAVAGLLLFGNPDQTTQLEEPHPTQQAFTQPTRVLPTATSETIQTTCAPDSVLSACSTYGFVRNLDRDSWVSNSTDNWIKIDTGQTAIINKIELDRESVNGFGGNFTILVAQSDNEYKQVYDSNDNNLASAIVGQETVHVFIEPVLARYVVVKVASPGMVINEVRAFSLPQTSTLYPTIENTKTANLPRQEPGNTRLPTRTPLPTNTTLPTSSPVPTNTPTATNTTLPTSSPVPTNTPTATNTALPTSSPVPTNTPTQTVSPTPTNTPIPTVILPPTNTLTPTLSPTSTPTP